MKHKGLIVILILLVIILGAAVFGYNKLSPKFVPEVAESETSQTKPLEAAPDFTVISTKGESIKLSDYKGKPVVINFWATWCPPCKAELPYFEQMYKEYGDTVEFMMVNLTDGQEETQEVVNTFIEDTGYTFPVYFDTEYSGAMAYGTYSIPVTVFVNRDGEIVYKKVGMIQEDMLKAFIERIVK